MEDSITITVNEDNLESLERVKLDPVSVVKLRIARLKIRKAKLQAELEEINAELVELRK